QGARRQVEGDESARICWTDEDALGVGQRGNTHPTRTVKQKFVLRRRQLLAPLHLAGRAVQAEQGHLLVVLDKGVKASLQGQRRAEEVVAGQVTLCAERRSTPAALPDDLARLQVDC